MFERAGTIVWICVKQRPWPAGRFTQASRRAPHSASRWEPRLVRDERRGAAPRVAVPAQNHDVAVTGAQGGADVDARCLPGTQLPHEPVTVDAHDEARETGAPV